MPVKKTPDISDIVGEKRMENEELRMENGELKMENGECEKAEKPKTSVIENEENNFPVLQSSALPVSEKNTPANFQEHWHAMFEKVFASVPTVFFTLKENLPEIENNIIKFVVKNKIQKEHFEAKTREALEYLRTHFDEQIEDIVVETNEQLETKKIIYDVKDKLQNFKEQNEEFEDFIQILELKIKD